MGRRYWRVAANEGIWKGPAPRPEPFRGRLSQATLIVLGALIDPASDDLDLTGG